jgi:putative membrane protein
LDSNDPRVYFAAERTLLAWVRTGLAVIGMGFVVERFGLFLQVTGAPATMASGPVSSAIGVGLVVLGSVSVGVAGWQHARFCQTLGPLDRPAHYAMRWPLVFTGLLTFIGLGLAAYLVAQQAGVASVPARRGQPRLARTAQFRGGVSPSFVTGSPPAIVASAR